MSVSKTIANLDQLDRTLDSMLILPEAEGWDEARAAWNLAVDQRPAAVAIPPTADDVARVVRAASRFGLEVATQTTGHNAGPLPVLDDVILLKTTSLTGVEIDFEARRARVGGGTTWFEVTEPASSGGLAPLAGSAPDVGVAGYTLGGGLSWLGRRYGLGSNAVVSIDVVTADGRHRTVDTGNDPDLFWALRGGGGNFGVVTALEFELFPAPSVVAGWLAWPWERSREVLSAWSDWTRALPDEVTSTARLLQVPGLPAIPESVRGRQLVVIEAAMLLSEPIAEDLLEPLRRLRPEIDTFALIPPVALSHLHMDPDEPVPTTGDHRLVSALPTALIDHIVDTAGPATDSPLVVVELRHLGGALARSTDDAGALDRLAGEHMLFAGGLTTDPETGWAIESRLHALLDGASPWDTGRRYSNFSEGRTDSRLFFSEETHRRLLAVRERVDPQRLFLANHAID